MTYTPKTRAERFEMCLAKFTPYFWLGREATAHRSVAETFLRDWLGGPLENNQDDSR